MRARRGEREVSTSGVPARGMPQQAHQQTQLTHTHLRRGEREVSISGVPAIGMPGKTITLRGTLVVPEACKGIVCFAHGSGSSRMSPRNRMVAKMLQDMSGWRDGGGGRGAAGRGRGSGMERGQGRRAACGWRCMGTGHQIPPSLC